MTRWPQTFHITQDGERLNFQYCCWTFCAWPEMLATLNARWRQRAVPSGTLIKCAECGMSQRKNATANRERPDGR